jgi:hypothetical protein
MKRQMRSNSAQGVPMMLMGTRTVTEGRQQQHGTADTHLN